MRYQSSRWPNAARCSTPPRVRHGQDRRRPGCRRRCRHHRPVSENLRRVAKAKKSSVSDLTVCILDRPRHGELIAQVRATGARIRLISEGDVAGAIAPARPESGTDLLIGTGGTPEGIIAAAAMRCMGGVLQARLAPTDDVERQKAIDGRFRSHLTSDVRRVTLLTSDIRCLDEGVDRGASRGTRGQASRVDR